MKSVNCDVIKDLLPSYIDQIASPATNELVEEHLMTCKDCCLALRDMNQDINVDAMKQQKEQIDYLKKYRKNKIITVIFVILFTITILLSTVLAFYFIRKHAEFFVSTDDIDISAHIADFRAINGEVSLTFDISSHQSDVLCHRVSVNQEDGNQIIYLKVYGLLTLGAPSRTCYSVTIDELKYTKKIYLEDKKGNLRELWDINDGPQMELSPSFNLTI